MTAEQPAARGPRLVQRRIDLIVEYWEDPAAVGAFQYDDPQWWAEADALQLYRVVRVVAGKPEPVVRTDYLLVYVGRDPKSNEWAIYDPTPGTGWEPLFTGTHLECRGWIEQRGGTVRTRGMVRA